MRYLRMAFWLVVLMVAGALVACSDGPGEVTAGTAVVTLSSPATDGAILLRLTGPGFETPQVTGTGSALYWRQVSESEIVVAVFGAVSSGALFRVEVPSLRRIDQYTATVLQVADRSDAERADLGGYVLSVSAAE